MSLSPDASLVALERLQKLPDGLLLYRLKKRWRDGTDGVVFEPFDFLECLAALEPASRFNMIRYSGVLAPAASWRARLAPCGEVTEAETQNETASERSGPPPDAPYPPDMQAMRTSALPTLHPFLRGRSHPRPPVPY